MKNISKIPTSIIELIEINFHLAPLPLIAERSARISSLHVLLNTITILSLLIDIYPDQA